MFIMAKKVTHSDFVEFVEDTFNGEFKVIGRYKKSNIKIEMYHEKCERYFEITPANFKFRRRCSLCHRNNKRTTVSYKEEVFNLVGDEYEVIGEYKTARDDIKMIHHKCGRHIHMTPDSFINSKCRCKFCSGNQRKTNEEHRLEVAEWSNGRLKFIGEYINNKTKTSYKHIECGEVFQATPDSIKRAKVGCPKCSVALRSKNNHYRYNPNLTEEERNARDMFNGEIKKWRTKIFERDDYTCVVCGIRGSSLNAHHILSWDTHIDERFSFDNGITLCESCHREFHKTFGYGNNNNLQLDLFLKRKQDEIS